MTADLVYDYHGARLTRCPRCGTACAMRDVPGIGRPYGLFDQKWRQHGSVCSRACPPVESTSHAR